MPLYPPTATILVEKEGGKVHGSASCHSWLRSSWKEKRGKIVPGGRKTYSNMRESGFHVFFCKYVYILRCSWLFLMKGSTKKTEDRYLRKGHRQFRKESFSSCKYVFLKNLLELKEVDGVKYFQEQPMGFYVFFFVKIWIFGDCLREQKIAISFQKIAYFLN